MTIPARLKIKADEAPARDVVSVACFYARRGAEVAHKLETAARAESDPLLIAEAQMIRASARPSNVWHAEDLTNEFGELYEGCGSLWQSGSRLAPAYMKDMRKRARVRVRGAVALANAQRKRGEHWRLVTLTMPTLIGVPLGMALGVLSDAWRHLTNRRAWFKQTISAGVKGEEFTLGDLRRQRAEGREWQLELDGYHPHIHVLALSGWIEYVRLRDEWTESLKHAAALHGIDLTFNTAHGGAVVDVRLVIQREKKGRRTITEAGAVEEVCKYITKAESWLKLPDAELCDVARVLRGRRMVELLGNCRAPQTPAPRKAERDDERAAVERDERARAEQFEIDARLVEWADAAPQGAPLLMCADVLDAARERVRAYLDTQNTSDGQDNDAEARAGPIRVPKARAAPLRKVGAFLIGQGREDIWLELLAAHVASVQDFRRVQLAARFPLARFSTLDGRTWFGSLVNPASSGDALTRYAERADAREAAAALSDADERREFEELRAETRAGRRAYADAQDRAAWARHLQESPTPQARACRVRSFAAWEAYEAGR